MPTIYSVLDTAEWTMGDRIVLAPITSGEKAPAALIGPRSERADRSAYPLPLGTESEIVVRDHLALPVHEESPMHRDLVIGWLEQGQHVHLARLGLTLDVGLVCWALAHLPARTDPILVGWIAIPGGRAVSLRSGEWRALIAGLREVAS
jgi:hypothetical protein